MQDPVSTHYSGGGCLADKIANDLRNQGIEPTQLSARDFESVDEFHFRGRDATLEILSEMQLTRGSRVLDIGSGLGGVARTIAIETEVHVTGVDLTQEFCDTATAISGWTGLLDKTEFRQGDATALPFQDNQFDGAVTVHVAMNIPNKEAVYTEARRVLKSGARFGIYDILQGDGGEVLYPAPWAQDPSISYLATPAAMSKHLLNAGFRIIRETDSTLESYRWLKERSTQPGSGNLLPVTTQLLFGPRSRDMVRHQLQGLKERRMLTYSFICEV